MMKKIYLILIFLGSCWNILSAQNTAKGINYQAVILDPKQIDIPGVALTGQPLASGNVCVKFSILNGQSLEYEEIQQTKTDEYGLINLTIGAGKATSNSKVLTFDGLKWNSKPFALSVSVSFDACANFKVVSTQLFNYTPYALYAESVDYVNVRNAPKSLSEFSNDVGFITNSALRPLSDSLAKQKIETLSKFLLVNQDISLVKSDISTLKTNVSNQGSQILDLNSKVDNLNTQFDSKLAGVNSNLSSQINNTNSRIDQLGGSFENLGNKSSSTNLGGSSPSDAKYPTQKAVKTYVDVTIQDAIATGAPDATTLAKGKVKLAGDLSGTADLPTVPGLALKEDVANKTTDITGNANSQVKYPTVKAMKDYVDASVTGLAFQANLDQKADKNSPTFTGSPVLPGTTIAVTQGINDNSTALATTAFVQNAISAGVIDATTDVKGKIKLAGDLSGTAENPTVPGLLLKESLSNKSDAATLGNSTDLYPTQRAVKVYVDNSIATAAVPDASNASKGKIQLGGDIAGSNDAAAPIITPGAISTGKLADGAVTTAKLASGAVTTSIIANGAVTNAKIGETISVSNGGTGANNPSQALTNLGAEPTLNKTTDVLSDGNSDVKFPSAKAVKSYVDQTVLAATPNATNSGLGKIQLGGDIAGNNDATAPSITPGAVTTGKIADGAITNSKIALGAVGTSSIANGAIVNTKIGEAISVTNGGTGATTAVGALISLGAEPTSNKSTSLATDGTSDTKFPSTKAVKSYVDSEITAAIAAGAPNASTSATGKVQLAGDLGGAGTTATAPIISNSAITTSKLGDNSVSTAKIIDQNVTTSKLALGAVTTEKIADLGVETAKIADLAVTTDKVSNLAITTAKIANAAVTDAKIATVSGSKVTGDIAGNAQNVNGVVGVANGGTGVAGVLSGYVKGNGSSVMTASPNIPLADVINAQAVTNLKTDITLGGNASSDVFYPSQKAVKDYVDNLTNQGVGTSTQNALNTKEDLANKSTSTSLGTSDVLYPSQNAVKQYVDTKLTSNNAIQNLTSLPNIANNTVLGNTTGATTTPKELQIIGAGKVVFDTNPTISNPTLSSTVINGTISGTAIVPVAQGGSGANMSNTSGYVKQASTGANFITIGKIPVTDVDQAVRTVNGVQPDQNGNVPLTIGTVYTGTLTNRPTTNLNNGDFYVVSNDGANNGLTYVWDGTTWQEVTPNQAATDARYVNITGDTMQGNLTVPTGNKVSIADLPTASTDAANKAYVDQQVTNATPDATANATGKIQLAGDLSGTASQPVIGVNKVTFDKMQQVAANVVIGTTAAGNVQALNTIPVATVPAFSGDVSIVAGTTTTTIGDKKVTYNKIQDLSGQSKLLGSGQNSGLTPTDISLGTGLSMSGNTLNSTGGTVTNVTGTASRVVVNNGTTTPSIDIASTYAGQTSITTLGTITTGTWEGSTVGVPFGGTGATSLTGYVKGNGTSAMTASSTIPVADVTNAETVLNKSTAQDLGGSTPSDIQYASQKAVKAYVDNTISTAISTGAPDATTTATGKVQLAGDLGGVGTSASAPVISAGAINSNKLADNSVTTFKIIDANVTTAKLANGSVTTEKMADLSVTTAKLTDGVVTNQKVSANAITSDKILDGEVNTSDLADASVVESKLANAAVTNSKIGLGAVKNNSIGEAISVSNGGTGATNAADARANLGAENVANKVTNFNSPDNNTYPTTQAVQDLVSSATPDATTSVKGKIKLDGDLAGTADLPIVADGKITSAKIADATIQSVDIAASAIETNNILNSAVSTAKLAIDAITTDKIKDGEVKAADLGTAAVETAKIADLAVSNAKIAAGAVTNDKISGPISVINGGTGAANAADARTNLGAEYVGNKATDFSIKNNTLYPTTAAVETYVATTIANTVLPATITDYGTIKIAGDLSGNAAAPLVADNAITTNKISNSAISSNKLADASVTTAKIASGGNDKVLISNSSGTVEWINKDNFTSYADGNTMIGDGSLNNKFKVKDLGITVTQLGNEAVEETKIKASAVTTVKIADLNVTTAKLANAAVTPSKMEAGANNTVLVTDNSGAVAWLDKNSFGAVADLSSIEGAGTAASPFKVKDLGIISAKLADGAVTTTKIAELNVTTAKVADAAITTAKIASGGNDKVLVTDVNGNVTWLSKTDFSGIADLSTIEGLGTTASPFKIKDLGIVEVKIANSAVTTNKIANSNVTTAKVADAAITTAKIASGGNDKVLVSDNTGIIAWIDKTAFGAVADQGTIEGAGTTASPFKVKDLGIVTAKLADNAVTNVKIATDAVTTAKIADGNITTEKVVNAAITTSKIASGGNDKVLVTDGSGAVTWLDKNSFGAVADLSTIEGLGTTASPFKVKDLGIITAKLADNAVTTAKIADANVTATKIADLNVTTAKLAENAVTTAKIADANVTNTKLGADAVTSAKILDGTIVNADIADATITSAKLSGAVAIANGGTGATTAAQALVNLGAEPTANKESAIDLGGASTSDTKFPSQKAVKTYVDAHQLADLTKLPTLANNKILGNLSGATATPQELPITGTNNVVLSSNPTINGIQLNGIITGTAIVPVNQGGSGANMSTTSGYVKQATTGANFSTTSTIPVADVTGAVRKVNGTTPNSNGEVTINWGTVYTGPLANRSTVVATPANGDIFVVSGDPTPANDGRTYIYDGTNWYEVTTNQASLDARYVQEAGDTMSGDLIMATGKKIILNYTPSGATDAANKSYVDSQLPVAATTSALGTIQMTGDLTGSGAAPAIANNAVTYAKMQTTSAASKLIGSGSTGTALGEISLGTGLSISGTTLNSTGGTVTNVSGTANRVTVTNGTSTPTVDIASTYAGQTSITTLGTITTGTWNGTTIAVANGGTGATTLTGYVKGNGTSAMTASGNIPVADVIGAQKTSDLTIDIPANAISDVKYPSAKAVVSYVTSNATPDATSTVKGKIKLTGDLGGTADAPTVPGLVSKENTITAGTTSQYWRGDKTWQSLDKAAVSLSNVDNTSDANKPISTATQSALDLKAPLASPALTGIPTAPTATAGTNTTQVATTAFVTTAVAAATIADATSAVKGKIQLGGDLAGTGSSAAAPVITADAITSTKIKDGEVATADLAASAVTTSKIASGGTNQLLTTDGSGAVTWLTKNSLVSADNTTIKGNGVSTPFYIDNQAITNALIAPAAVGMSNIAQSSATSGQVIKWNGTAWVPAADNGLTTETQTLSISTNQITISGTNSSVTLPDASTSVKGLIQIGGDLSGTTTSQTVAKIQGKAISTTAPTSGQVLKWNATSSQWEPGTDNSGLSAVPDATTTTNGIIRLAGDLGGSGSTAAAPIIANNAIGTSKIADGSVTAAKLSNMNATNGQVLKFNGTTWAPAADDSGLGTITSVSNTLTPTSTNIQLSTTVQGTTGTAVSIPGATATALGLVKIAGALSGTYDNISLAANSVSGSNITDASVGSADLAAGAVLNSNIGETITVAKGGTGATTLTGYVKGNGTAAMTASSSIPVADVIGAQTTANLSSNITTNTGSTTMYPSVAAIETYVTSRATPSATTSAEGKIQLAQDLAGTSALPRVVGLQGKPISANTPTTNQLLKYNGTNWVPANLSLETDEFTATAGQTSFTLTNAPMGRVAVFRNGIRLPKASISVTGTTVTYTSTSNNNQVIALNDRITIDYVY